MRGKACVHEYLLRLNTSLVHEAASIDSGAVQSTEDETVQPVRRPSTVDVSWFVHVAPSQVKCSNLSMRVIRSASPHGGAACHRGRKPVVCGMDLWTQQGG